MVRFDFDQWTKDLAGGASRREMLRRLGVGLVGGALALSSTGKAVAQAGDEPPRQAVCNQCIAMFVGRCVSTCVEAFEPEICPQACYEGSVTACTIIGQCP